MKVAAAKTYDRILDLGLQMLSMNGLSGVTFGALARTVGMSKSGLFAHFRSKEDIQRRLLIHAEALVEVHVVGPAMAEPPGLPRLGALMRRWLGWPQRAGLGGGCPIAAAMFELDDLDGDVRAQVGDAEARSRSLLAELVREAVEEEVLQADADVDQIVWELRSIYLGHHVSGRFVGETLADDRALAAFEALIHRYRR